MFKYMIGNADWRMPNLHNIELFYRFSLITVVIIAYDFDFCEFVHTPYTKLPETIPIREFMEPYSR